MKETVRSILHKKGRENDLPIMDKLTYYGYIVIAIIVVIVICAGILYIIREKKRKTRRLNEDNTDYSSFNRKDSCDYIKIDDIKDNIIILDNGKRFVGVVACQGYDLYSAEEEEQASTAQNFVSFVNTIKKPISYRQYSKNIDLEYTMNMYEEAHKQVETKLYNVTEDMKDLEKTISNGTVSESQYDLYSGKIEELQIEKRALENREYHLVEQINYCKSYSGTNVLPELKETWVFEWCYYPYDFPVELTQEEIYKRAIQELKTMENSFRHALSSCRVKTKRCNTEELIEMCRRYSAPLSSERYRLRDLLSSSYFEDIVTTNNVDEMIEKARKKVEEDFIYSFEEDMRENISQIEIGESNQKEKADMAERKPMKHTGPRPAKGISDKGKVKDEEGGLIDVI